MPDEESVPMSKLDNNDPADNEPEPTEKSPLNGTDAEAALTDKELEAIGANKEKEAAEENGKATGIGALLAHPRFRVLGVVILVSFFTLLAVIIGVVLFAVTNPELEQWIEDTEPRALRLTPTPNGPKNLIKFRAGHGNEGNGYSDLVAQINSLYDQYNGDLQRERSNVTICAINSPPPEGKACYVDLEPIKKLCSGSNNETYGYAEGSPCIFLHLNFKLLTNYTPSVYTQQELTELPGLPDDLRKQKNLQGPWVECHGNTNPDVEAAGKIEVAPSNVIPYFYFPYNGHPDYLSPLVAIKFTNPVPAQNIGITCKLWASNIGNRIVVNPETNQTTVERINEQLPLAELPLNLYLE